MNEPLVGIKPVVKLSVIVLYYRVSPIGRTFPIYSPAGTLTSWVFFFLMDLIPEPEYGFEKELFCPSR